MTDNVDDEPVQPVRTAAGDLLATGDYSIAVERACPQHRSLRFFFSYHVGDGEFVSAILHKYISQNIVYIHNLAC